MALPVVATFARHSALNKLFFRSISFSVYHQLNCKSNLIQSLCVYQKTPDFTQKYQFQGAKLQKIIKRNNSVNAAATKDVDEYRHEHNIKVVGDNVPEPYVDVDSSEFPDYIKNYLKEKGFTTPTVIQAQGWPIAMKGQNLVGIAQTGTGKTLAYLLPAIVHIKEKSAKKGLGPIVLVMAPTRELARQIEQVAIDFRRLLNIRCACIYGGASRGPQEQQLNRGVDLIIATPGRLNDFLRSNVTTLNRCTYVVLDEADRMLDMGFEPQIREALEGIPIERQMLMWSATWPREVQELARDYLGNFVQVNVGSTELSANHNIEQHIHVCDEEEKMDKLKELMHNVSGGGFGKMLIFANTKIYVDRLTYALRKNGWKAEGIHGGRSQLQRDTIIARYKSGRANILVATDVAARGLDVDGVTHVINYDFPNTSEDYIHRIGRTGRKQNKGTSHTLLSQDDARQAPRLIQVLKEANQNIPQELMDMMGSYQEDRYKHKQTGQRDWQPKKNWGQKPRWSRYSNRY